MYGAIQPICCKEEELHVDDANSSTCVNMTAAIVSMDRRCTTNAFRTFVLGQGSAVKHVCSVFQFLHGTHHYCKDGCCCCLRQTRVGRKKQTQTKKHERGRQSTQPRFFSKAVEASNKEATGRSSTIGPNRNNFNAIRPIDTSRRIASLTFL